MAKVDAILIGGAMAYTFLQRARGRRSASSRVEEDKLRPRARADGGGREAATSALMLPVDHVVAASPEAGTAETVERFASDRMGLDIGPRTVEEFIATAPGREDRDLERAAGIF